MDIRYQLIRDEDRRLDPYLDCCGKYWRDCACEKKGNLTIGCGRNLDSSGISHAETLYLLDNDIAEKTKGLAQRLPWASSLDPLRFAALLNLAFNMGIEGLVTRNPKFIALMRVARFQEAGEELLKGSYKDQVGERAYRIAKQIETGVWQ